MFHAPHATVAAMAARQPTLLESCFSSALRMLPLKHGAHRILDHLRPRPWVDATPLVDVAYRGHLLRMDVSDLVGWHFLMLRNFDPEVTEILARYGRPEETDVFWDIGANKGACSFEIATALPRARIVAIEPQQGLRPLLEKNLAVVAPQRYLVCSVAIGEEAGCAEIFVPPANVGAASLVPRHRPPGGRVERIRIVTAETVKDTTGYGWPTLVKIDVEGFEPSVIRSLAPAFATGRVRCCVFECHPTEPDAYAQIRACTERHGYRLHAIRKTPFSTTLVPAPGLVAGSTDYAIVRDTR